MAKSKMRAAAYCRVSTSKEEQLDSYSANRTFSRNIANITISTFSAFMVMKANPAQK